LRADITISRIWEARDPGSAERQIPNGTPDDQLPFGNAASPAPAGTYQGTPVEIARRDGDAPEALANDLQRFIAAADRSLDMAVRSIVEIDFEESRFVVAVPRRLLFMNSNITPVSTDMSWPGAAYEAYTRPTGV